MEVEEEEEDEDVVEEEDGEAMDRPFREGKQVRTGERANSSIDATL